MVLGRGSTLHMKRKHQQSQQNNKQAQNMRQQKIQKALEIMNKNAKTIQKDLIYLQGKLKEWDRSNRQMKTVSNNVLQQLNQYMNQAIKVGHSKILSGTGFPKKCTRKNILYSRGIKTVTPCSRLNRTYRGFYNEGLKNRLSQIITPSRENEDSYVLNNRFRRHAGMGIRIINSQNALAYKGGKYRSGRI